MKKYYVVMTQESFVERTECSSLNEAENLLEIANNTFYDDPEISYHIEYPE
jgi:hypothetical protein